MGSDTTVTSGTSMLTDDEIFAELIRNPPGNGRQKSKSAVRTFASRDFNSSLTLEDVDDDFMNDPTSPPPEKCETPKLQPRFKTKSAIRTFAARDFDFSQSPSYDEKDDTLPKVSMAPKVPSSPRSTSEKMIQMKNKMKEFGKHKKQKQSRVGLDDLDKSRRSCGDFHDIIVHYELYGKPIEMVYDGVHDGFLLGEGVTGLVRQVTHRVTGAQYAVKCLDISKIKTDDQLQQLRQEIEIMCRLDHPHIVRLEEVYESDEEIYLIQELCRGGDLFDALDNQENGVYTEAQCITIVKQMLSSLRYLHSKGIVHRDLKLENFLFTTEDSGNSSGFVHMIDFGLAKHFSSDKSELKEHVGTPYTVAPEVISSPSYDEKCDVWAIGVLTYLLLSGETPFGGDSPDDDLREVRENILSANYTFYPDLWDGISSEAKDFISQLLVLDPNQRPNPVQCQSHPWLQQLNNSDSDLSPKNQSDGVNHSLQQQLGDCHFNQDCDVNPNIVKSLMEFQEYSTMQRLLREVLSYTLLPEQIGELKQEFLKIDVQGTGEICYSDFKRVLLSSSTDQSEESIRQIFNSLRIPQQVSPESSSDKDVEPTIHWHEFIAAELSLCHVDDHNIKRAFDRLDYDHKGYITCKNLQELFCHGFDWERMWKDSINFAHCEHPDRITYPEFLRLVKQPKVKTEQSSVKSPTVSPKKSSATPPAISTPSATSPPPKPSKKKQFFFFFKGLKCNLHLSNGNNSHRKLVSSSQY